MMSVLRRYCVGAFAALISGSVAAQEVPSGQPVSLYEVLIDNVNDESWLRFRFIAPRIARVDGGINFDQAEADMAHLCASFVVPYMSEYDLKSDLVVISFSDQETEFGETNPDATQFYDAYRLENDTCIWEAF